MPAPCCSRRLHPSRRAHGSSLREKTGRDRRTLAEAGEIIAGYWLIRASRRVRRSNGQAHPFEAGGPLPIVAI